MTLNWDHSSNIPVGLVELAAGLARWAGAAAYPLLLQRPPHPLVALVGFLHQ